MEQLWDLFVFGCCLMLILFFRWPILKTFFPHVKNLTDQCFRGLKNGYTDINCLKTKYIFIQQRNRNWWDDTLVHFYSVSFVTNRVSVRILVGKKWGLGKWDGESHVTLTHPGLLLEAERGMTYHWILLLQEHSFPRIKAVNESLYLPCTYYSAWKHYSFFLWVLE